MSETQISPPELLCRLENILRPGTIHAVDHDGARVRLERRFEPKIYKIDNNGSSIRPC